MNTETTLERKVHLHELERQLRLDGDKLDMLWMAARLATGQEKTNLHNQIAPLREKQRADRVEQEALKKEHAVPLD